MLAVSVQRIRNTTVVRCRGRIVVGENLQWLRNFVAWHASPGSLVIDLGRVDRIDAGGLGFLLDLRELASGQAIRFRLMNAVNNVDRVLRLTRLDRVFEFCSVDEMLSLACLAQRRLGSDLGAFPPGGSAGHNIGLR